MLAEVVGGFWNVWNDKVDEVLQRVFDMVGGVREGEEIYDWFGRRCEIGGLQGNNLCRVWYEVVRVMEE